MTESREPRLTGAQMRELLSAAIYRLESSASVHTANNCDLSAGAAQRLANEIREALNRG